MKISIVTATYNSAATIKDTFNSVIAQTYNDIEYIVVDGLSKDNTLDIIKEYEPLFGGRMRWISEKDKGLYDAMNKGIAMATGDVIGILNSDDFYTSTDILQLVADSMQDSEIDAVYGDIHFVNNDNLDKCVRYYSSRIFSRWLMRYGFMPAHPSFYCKREVYTKYGAFNTKYKIGADFESLLRYIFVNRIRTKYIKRDFVTMRTGGASTEGLSSRWQIMKDHLRALKDNGIYSNALLLCLRYPYKIYELMTSKLKYNSKRAQKQ
ncbi:MAG: glycosyltransferase [Bacteroidaceae bacterium]|nr:glycosyltransferase [Bacteroidaceae bacterium]